MKTDEPKKVEGFAFGMGHVFARPGSLIVGCEKELVETAMKEWRSFTFDSLASMVPLALVAIGLLVTATSWWHALPAAGLGANVAVHVRKGIRLWRQTRQVEKWISEREWP